jgi:hypothetical protein
VHCEPLKLAAGHFGLSHGSGAHTPDEYYVIESSNPKIQGFEGAVMSFVEYRIGEVTMSAEWQPNALPLQPGNSRDFLASFQVIYSLVSSHFFYYGRGLGVGRGFGVG